MTFTVEINKKWCKKCGLCAHYCPTKVFELDDFGLDQGVLELAGFVLLVVLKVAPGSWSAVESAIPALASLRTAVGAFTGSRAFPQFNAEPLQDALAQLQVIHSLVIAQV